MKVIINEKERGFVFRNGTFSRMLMPGKNKIGALRGETYKIVAIDQPVAVPGADIEVLMRDKAFAESAVRIDVPDGAIAVRFEDGRVIEALGAGKHCYFDPYKNVTYKLFDLTSTEISGLTAEQLDRLPADVYRKLVVLEGETGLLFYDGKYVRALKPGSYYFWNTRTTVAVERVDLRAQELEINGQEILTADKVSLRVNFVCAYRVTDAVKIFADIKDYKTQIYTLTQLALREYVGRFRFDELLEQKENVAAAVLEKLRVCQKDYYVEFVSAGLKDIVLPGEIRDIMNTVLVAEKNAQANVIARREEVASTRSLLNTAKLLDENATLYKLKELEYLERICDKVGSISVGGGSLLSELQKIVGISVRKE